MQIQQNVPHSSVKTQTNGMWNKTFYLEVHCETTDEPDHNNYVKIINS